MSFDVYGYLDEKLPWIKRASEVEIHAPCPFHGEDPTKRGRLYVNITPDADPLGLFKCHRCGETGGLNKIRKFYGDPILKSDEYSGKPATSDRSMEIMGLAAKYYHERLSNDKYKFAYEFLRIKRGLTPNTIQDHLLGWSDGTACNMLVNKGFTHEELIASGIMDKTGRDAFRNMITIPYHLNGNVVDIRGKDINGKYKTLPGHSGRPYNIDSVQGETVVVVNEGEFDALIAEQLRICLSWNARVNKLARSLEHVPI